MNTTARWGLGLMALLSLNDIAGLALTDGGKHPPYAVAAFSAMLGLISLFLVARVWRGQSGLKILLVLRVVSALSAIPAFFASDLPVGVVIDAAAIVAFTAVATLLLARRSMPATAATAQAVAR